MSRRAAAAAADLAATSRAASFRRGVRWFFWTATLLIAALSALWLYSTVEQFLMSDSRFFLPGPPEPGIPSENFRVEGTVNASEQQILAVFQRDFGRSVYLTPIAERRRRLLGIDWVKEASVSRVWPNRLVVRISERVPIAFVQIPRADRASMHGLIDADGVLLDPQRVGKMNLPVLAGMPASDTEATRRERVKRFLRLQSEVGPLINNISEIDVGDLDNLKVVYPLEGRAVILLLGNQKYKERLENFVNNVAQIRERLPGATVLDLRVPGRITAIGVDPAVQAATSAADSRPKGAKLKANRNKPEGKKR